MKEYIIAVNGARICPLICNAQAIFSVTWHCVYLVKGNFASEVFPYFQGKNQNPSIGWPKPLKTPPHHPHSFPFFLHQQVFCDTFLTGQNISNWLFKCQEKQNVRERMADLVNFANITANGVHLLIFHKLSCQGTAVLVFIAHRISSINSVIYL